MQIERIDLGYEPEITNQFVIALEEIITALDEKIQLEQDELKEKKYELQRFWAEEDVFAGKQSISITKMAADKLIDRQILRYDIVIGILSEIFKILKQRLETGFYTDKLEAASAKYDYWKTFVEIRAKKEFRNKHQERKKIYNK
ncbi:MAG: hypothetical protein PHX80_04650 [Candidatus Nanoarchaeia archaeon]|nr:hypothetical protein [Candidatus Nanoarchaeia archaeon]